MLPGSTPATAGARYSLDHVDDGGDFAEIAAELAAPILQRRRLAPADPAGVIGHLDQQVAADRLGKAGPFVLAPGGNVDEDRLDRLNARQTASLPEAAPLLGAQCDHTL